MAGAPLVILGSVPRERHDADAPRLDYEELAEALGAHLAHPPKQGPGAALRFARSLRRTKSPVVVSLSEAMGLPIALAGPRGVPHVMVAHNLTTPRRRAFQRATRWLHRIDRVVVLCRAQERYLREEVGLPQERVHFVFDKVDHRFFTAGTHQDGLHVLAVGREQRDYATLVEAVRGTGLRTVLVPSSLWMGDEVLAAGLPEEIEIRRDLPYPELRELYARALAVAVPLQPGIEYAAGVNAVLEAMAMEAPVVATQTPGIADYVGDGLAVTVQPGDAAGLRAALRSIADDPSPARERAGRARDVIEHERNLDVYVGRLAALAAELSR